MQNKLKLMHLTLKKQVLMIMLIQKTRTMAKPSMLNLKK